MTDNIRGILDANVVFRNMEGAPRLSLSSRAQIITTLSALHPEVKEYLEQLSDGDLVTLTVLMADSRDELAGAHAVLGFLVGYFLRHEQVPS